MGKIKQDRVRCGFCFNIFSYDGKDDLYSIPTKCPKCGAFVLAIRHARELLFDIIPLKTAVKLYLTLFGKEPDVSLDRKFPFRYNLQTDDGSVMYVTAWKPDELLTSKLVASILNVTGDYVAWLARNGKLKAERSEPSRTKYARGRWLIRRDTLSDYIEKRFFGDSF